MPNEAGNEEKIMQRKREKRKGAILRHWSLNKVKGQDIALWIASKLEIFLNASHYLQRNNFAPIFSHSKYYILNS